jgi:hypothetical protein
MLKPIKLRNKMMVIMVIVLLISSITTAFATENIVTEKANGFSDSTSLTSTKSTWDKGSVNLSGYAYNPNPDNDFKFISDITLDINFKTNEGRLVSDRSVFELDFKIDKEENGRVDYSGQVKNGEITKDLLLSVVNDQEMKVYGLIDGEFAFNAGNTITHSKLKEKVALSLEGTNGDISILASSTDPYVVDDGTRNNIYAQLIRPQTHPSGQVGTYGIRINTTSSGVDPLRTVRKFKATGTVTGSELINTNPSGDAILPTPWYIELSYYFFAYVGLYVDTSAGYAYKGSIINSNYQMEIGANEKWANFIYDNDSSTNGCGFKLHINNDQNKLPDITVYTSLNIYESLTGYLTISGPTLSY